MGQLLYRVERVDSLAAGFIADALDLVEMRDCGGGGAGHA